MMQIPLFLLGRAGHKLNEPHKNSPKEYWRLIDIAQGFPWFSWMKGTGFLLDSISDDASLSAND